MFSGVNFREAGAAGGCCDMEIKTRLRGMLMLLWIFQGKLINPPTLIKPGPAANGSLRVQQEFVRVIGSDKYMFQMTFLFKYAVLRKVITVLSK